MHWGVPLVSDGLGAGWCIADRAARSVRPEGPEPTPHDVGHAGAGDCGGACAAALIHYSDIRQTRTHMAGCREGKAFLPTATRKGCEGRIPPSGFGDRPRPSTVEPRGLEPLTSCLQIMPILPCTCAHLRKRTSASDPC
jgi:hypothetical protein